MWYWTQTTSYFSARGFGTVVNSNGYVYDRNIRNSGDLLENGEISGGGVVPVINIAPDYAEKMIGNGTVENPYEISI